MTVSSNFSNYYGLKVKEYVAGKGISNPSKTAVLLREDSYDSKISLDSLMEAFGKEPKLSEVKAIVIGCWEEAFEEGPDNIIKHLTSMAESLSNLEALFVGDMTYEECEISWINQSDLAPLIHLFPNLREFGCRGGNGLELDGLSHEKLETLVVQTGGLSGSTLRQISTAKLPNLKKLEIWLGTEDYGFDGSLFDIRPILDGQFPKLKHLGLMNSEISDQIAESFQISQTVTADEIEVSGKSFVLTGTLHNIKRSDASKQLEELGANIASGISKNVDYLIAGEKAGSKMEKAKSLGIPVLSEQDLLKLLGLVEQKAVSKTSGTFSLLGQLETLDLSMGTLGDKGGKALLNHPKIKNLKFLNLRHHYMSEEIVQQFSNLGIQVDVSEAKDAEEDDGDRYVEVSE